MFRIAKRFEFCASHALVHLPEGHKCREMHGHNYTVEVELAWQTVTKEGFVLDYGDLAPIKQWLDETLDHRHLNDVLPCLPTAELIARFIFDRWQGSFP